MGLVDGATTAAKESVCLGSLLVSSNCLFPCIMDSISLYLSLSPCIIVSSLLILSFIGSCARGSKWSLACSGQLLTGLLRWSIMRLSSRAFDEGMFCCLVLVAGVDLKNLDPDCSKTSRADRGWVEFGESSSRYLGLLGSSGDM